MIWKTPARTTANKKIGNEPKSEIEARTMEVKPAAGPLTLSLEPLIDETTIPPIMPDNKPESKFTFWDRAIPKQSGRATKKTINPDFKSYFKFVIQNFLSSTRFLFDIFLIL